MKYLFFVFLYSTIISQISAQNVGIGTNAPLMKLHVSTHDSAVAIFENTQPLGPNVSTGLYFKTGSGIWPYTGAIKTIGETNGSARLGLFTYASATPNLLRERISVNDDGRVGFGTISPQASLQINPNGAGSLLIGTNKSSGGYTNIEMGISSQSNGYGFLQATKASGSNYGALALNANGGNVGVGTTTPGSSLDINGGISLPVKVVTSDYAATNKDYTIVANMQNNLNGNIKIYLPVATPGRIINVVGINLPNKYISGPNGPTNHPNGNIEIVNEDGSILNYWAKLNFSSGQQEYQGLQNSMTTINLYKSTTNMTFQYVNAQIGWIILILSTDSSNDYDTHYS